MLSKITGLLFIVIGLGIIVVGVVVGNFLMKILGGVAGFIFGGLIVLLGCWVCKFGNQVSKG